MILQFHIHRADDVDVTHIHQIGAMGLDKFDIFQQFSGNCGKTGNAINLPAILQMINNAAVLCLYIDKL